MLVPQKFDSFCVVQRRAVDRAFLYSKKKEEVRTELCVQYSSGEQRSPAPLAVLEQCHTTN
jgi:hypothetical protein